LNLIDLLRGILAGYALKILQILASLLVIPFLLRDDVLGIEAYGRVFSVIASLALVNIVTDGLRVSYSRSIAQALSISREHVAECIGSGFKAMALVVAAIGIVLYAARLPVLELLGLPLTSDWKWVISIAITHVLAENLLYIFQSYALARGRLERVNHVLGLEVIVRSIALVVFFSIFRATPLGYMVIYSTVVIARCLSFAVDSILAHPEDFRGIFRAPVARSLGAIRYSFAISGASLQYFVLYRLSIPMVNKWIGSEAAGMLAIALNTIATNASQVLFSVVRPILVPLASRIDLAVLSPERRRLVHDLDALYSIGVGLFMVPLVGLMPLFISLWLGDGYVSLVFPAQVLVAGAALQVSFNVRRAMLVGQGHAARVARTSIVIAILSAISLIGVCAWLSDWKLVAWVIAGFAALNSALAHGWIYEQRVLRTEDRKGGTVRVVFSLSVCFAITGSLSHWAGGAEWLGIPVAIAALGLVVVMSHLVILPIPRVQELVAQLRRSARSPIFPADVTSSRESHEPLA
jgi:O-antigen/teichoic acid export membrane protein